MTTKMTTKIPSLHPLELRFNGKKFSRTELMDRLESALISLETSQMKCGAYMDALDAVKDIEAKLTKKLSPLIAQQIAHSRTVPTENT